MYGTQTVQLPQIDVRSFENDVNMYGTQTRRTIHRGLRRFENDVNMYGTQTHAKRQKLLHSLRMM